MRALLTLVTGLATLAAFTAASHAQVGCPSEVGQAKELLARKGGLKAEGQAQPPKSLAGARPESQAPRSLAGTQWTGRLVRASRLVHEAEAACRAGDATTAKQKAEAALVELK